MHTTALLLASLASSTVAAETVVGAYIFSRHGDRSSKSTPPTVLTDLGYQEIFTSGSYYRSRYIASDASRKINGIASSIVKLSQITASAPVDNVLQASGAGFLQGLYPPVGETLGSQTLRNGTVVQSPLNGYQLVPLQVVQNGANSEDAAWLQGATNCANAQISSNDYFASAQYNETLNRTRSFYTSMYPFVNRTFAANQSTFKNAYTIFDLLNVAEIHNASVSLPSDDDLFQLRTLADQHEFALAYNVSEPIRAVTGSIIAAQVTQALNATITGKGKNVLNIQFGAYAGMLSYFGLANLTADNTDFFGVPDYASSLVWELVTNATVSNTSFPNATDIGVRFYFHNGTTSNISEPVEYPLFGSSQSPLPWSQFVSSTAKFSIGTQSQWCTACGNSTGVCSAASLGDSSSSNNSSSSGTGIGSSSSSSPSSSSDTNCHSGGISKAVAGVIGAVVTLGVILGLEILLFLIGGYTLISKKQAAGTAQNGGNGVGNGAMKA